MLKGFFKDLIKYVPGKIVPAIIGFISIPILTRIFTPETYGNYTLVLSIVNFLSITVGWVGMSNIRFYPVFEKENRLQEYSSTVLKVTVLSISVSALLYTISILILKNKLQLEVTQLLWLSIPYFMLLAVFTVSQNFLRVNGRIGLFSYTSIWRVSTSFLFGIALIFWLNFDIRGLFLGSIASISIAVIYIFNKSFGKVSLNYKLNYSIIKEFFFYSFPLVISNSLAFITKFSDRFLLAHFKNSHEVGIYAANYTIADKSILIIVSLFLYAAHPLSIKIWEKSGVEKSKEFLSKTTAIYIALTLPAVFGISALKMDVAQVLLDKEYISGIIILPIISIASFMFGLQQRFQSGIHFFKKTKYVTFSIILATLVSIISNLILIPRIGFLGAAISNLIAYTVMAIYMIIYSRRLIKWAFPFAVTIKSLIASCVMTFLVIIIPFETLSGNIYYILFSKLCFGMVIYLLLMLLFKTFDRKYFNQDEQSLS